MAKPPSKTHLDLIKAVAQKYAMETATDVGEPVNMTEVEFQRSLETIKIVYKSYPNLAFWMVLNLRTNTIQEKGGMETIFGKELNTLVEVLERVHPDYVWAYLKWSNASYELGRKTAMYLAPLQLMHRISIPMLGADGVYYWFSQHATITQLDAKGYIVTHLNTYFIEGKWSPLNRRPFDVFTRLRDQPEINVEQLLNEQMAPYILDEFTNSELDVLSAYIMGKKAEEIAGLMNWSIHTLHEYNGTILKKARRLFQYDFKTAQKFAGFCLEKHFLRKREG